MATEGVCIRRVFFFFSCAEERITLGQLDGTKICVRMVFNTGVSVSVSHRGAPDSGPCAAAEEALMTA